MVNKFCEIVGLFQVDLITINLWENMPQVYFCNGHGCEINRLCGAMAFCVPSQINMMHMVALLSGFSDGLELCSVLPILRGLSGKGAIVNHANKEAKSRSQRVA